MDPPPLKLPATPAMVLFPLSPERINGTRPPYDGGKLPQSPSLPEFAKGSIDPSVFFSNGTSTPPSRHSRNHSEAHVQGMVARFDALTIKDYRQRDEVAIKRVEMAREMAELERDRCKKELLERQEDVKKTKEEARRLRKELEEMKERERRVVKRLDVVMEELHRAKENHNLAVGIYEKEIRKAKKEAFKSGSGMVKLQEELKATRASLNVVKANLETEKSKSGKREQDAFTAQYQLVGLQEELLKAQERLKVVEEERDALKTSLKEEEIAKIAAEGQIALPPDEDEDDLASPMKSPRKPMPSDSEDKENIVPRRKGQRTELKSLQEELVLERRMRERAQEQVDFMKMECQFQCCSCRLAERQGIRYIHDDSFSSEMERIKQALPIIAAPPEDEAVDVDMDWTIVPESTNDRRSGRKTATLIDISSPKQENLALEEEFDDTHNEAGSILNPNEVIAGNLHDVHNENLSTTSEAMKVFPEEPVDQPSSPRSQSPTESSQPPQTPIQHEFRTVTTTTTIPITFSPFQPSDLTQPSTPMTVAHPPLSQVLESPFPSKAFRPDGTLDREAALEQIRQRRGRARSVAMGYTTPKKQMVEVVGPNGRRDISAPTLRAWTKG